MSLILVLMLVYIFPKNSSLRNFPRYYSRKTSLICQEENKRYNSHVFDSEFCEEEFEFSTIPKVLDDNILRCPPSLVLNADYTPLSHLPLSLINWQDAIRAIFANKATVVAGMTSIYLFIYFYALVCMLFVTYDGRIWKHCHTKCVPWNTIT